MIGGRHLYLLPLFHPAAGLRTPRVAEQLREDFRQIPDLLAAAAPGAGAAGSESGSPSRTRWACSAVDATHSAAETEAVGERLAAELGPGDVVLVSGELGAGQDHPDPRRGAGTRRHRAGDLADLHDRPHLRGRVPVSHLDLYRLADLGQEDPALLDDYLTPGGGRLHRVARRRRALARAGHPPRRDPPRRRGRARDRVLRHARAVIRGSSSRHGRSSAPSYRRRDWSIPRGGER